MVRQSTFAPETFTIRAYFVELREMNCGELSGVFGDGSAPCAVILSRMSGEFRILVTSAFHFAMTSGGVPAGAKKPNHVEMSKPGNAGFRHRRQLGHELRALGGRHRERFQLAGLDLRHRVGEVVEHELGVAGEQRLGGRGAALERHVDDVRSGVDLEQFAGQMTGAAVAARAERELAGIRLRVGDEVLRRVDRLARIHDEDVGVTAISVIGAKSLAASYGILV